MKSAVFSTLIATVLVLAGISTVTRSYAATIPVFNADSLKAHMIKDWERAKLFTKAYLEAMPEDGINFKPTPEIRSFAEQMLHLAQGTVSLVSNGTGQARIFQGKNLEQSEELKNKEALMKVVMESYDFAIEGVKNIDPSKFEEIVKRGHFEVTRLGWIMKAFEHQTHHRGQCTIYLRLKGIKPPNEMLF